MPKKKTKKKTAKKKVSKKVAVESYRHESATRKNIPTAKIAAEGIVPRVAKAKYSYSAHMSPELRFDASGQSDRVSDIVEKATAGNKLTKEEADILRGVAANASQPWLEWSGKKEEHDRGVLEVEPVALHIHERVSANAIVRAAKREDVQADLFADPQQDYKEAIQFYKHDVDWANRLVLGDSLEVMSSLAKRENLAGKVQMVYFDPPYGIKYKSNFQPNVSTKNVKEREADLTREAEMVKAFRDTWHLGRHSYLSYLRERLVLCRTLMAETGSIFFQIGDENVHVVRQLLDEVFGPENAICTIYFRKKTMPLGAKYLESMGDYIVWYCKDKTKAYSKFRRLMKSMDIVGDFHWNIYEGKDGHRLKLTKTRIKAGVTAPPDADVCRLVSMWPPTFSEKSVFNVDYAGKSWSPAAGQCWSTNPEGMRRLIGAERVDIEGNYLRYVLKHSDDDLVKLGTIWNDTVGARGKSYVVETSPEVVKRCMLMTTDPGDLVLDPTCGGGTTAYVAEEWGRRWITIDSSRISISLARQRIVTAKFPYFSLANDAAGVGGGFVLQTKARVSASDIANNQNLDAIFDEFDPLLDAELEKCNAALSYVTDAHREILSKELAARTSQIGKSSITEAELRKWVLPRARENWGHWQVPFGTDDDWPEELKFAVTSYRRIWRARTDAVEECIATNAEQRELVDSPDVETHTLRVAGPFTVEGVRPEELSLDEKGELFDPTPNEWELSDGQGEYSQNVTAYLDRMLQLIDQDGVTFPNNEHRRFALVERLEETDSALHAEALWEGAEDGGQPNIAIAFGPQHGPVTASQVEDLIRASRRYDELVIAAFSFDGSSQAVIQESANPRLKIHMAHIRPDVSPGMDGLLKDSPKSQLFTVFGQPEIKLHEKDGEVNVELLGVDIYSPLTGEISSSGANKVAAWFLDSNYDGRCFCITQAFFPNQKAWDKIAKSLGSSADAEAFEAYNGTVSVPFEPGEHQCIAVKVIDPRGNEVMAIRSLTGAD